MALSTANVTKVFKLFGLPQRGYGYVAEPLIRGLTPSGAEYDFTELTAKLTAVLATLSATQQTEVEALLTEWDAVKDYGTLEVLSDSGAQGTLVSHSRERKQIRAVIANLIGFHVPTLGFAAEAEGGQCEHRIVK